MLSTASGGRGLGRFGLRRNYDRITMNPFPRKLFSDVRRVVFDEKKPYGSLVHLPATALSYIMASLSQYRWRTAWEYTPPERLSSSSAKERST
jgi:hypothetical protein